MRSVGGEWGGARWHSFLAYRERLFCAEKGGKKKKNFWKLTWGRPPRNIKYTLWKTGRDLSIYSPCKTTHPFIGRATFSVVFQSNVYCFLNSIQWGKSRWGNTPRLGSKPAVGELWRAGNRNQNLPRLCFGFINDRPKPKPLSRSRVGPEPHLHHLWIACYRLRTICEQRCWQTFNRVPGYSGTGTSNETNECAVNKPVPYYLHFSP